MEEKSQEVEKYMEGNIVFPREHLSTTLENAKTRGSLFGTELGILRETDIDALRAGKMVALDISGGEYVLFIVLRDWPDKCCANCRNSLRCAAVDESGPGNTCDEWEGEDG